MALAINGGTSKVRKIFKEDLAKRNPKDPELYLRRRKQCYINFEKGDGFEKIFQKLMGGIKPDKSISTAFTKRFLDNVKGNIGRELKSGPISLSNAFRKQVQKDIDIVKREIDPNVSKIEWHVIEGMDQAALDFIFKLATENEVLDKIKIVIY